MLSKFFSGITNLDLSITTIFVTFSTPFFMIPSPCIPSYSVNPYLFIFLMSLITSITVQTVAYSLTQNAHFLSTTVNGVSITSSTSSIWGKKDEAWGRKIVLLVNKSECMHNYWYIEKRFKAHCYTF